MKSNFNKRKKVINKLLEFKCNSFKRKYFLMSLFTETNISQKSLLKSKFNVYKDQLFKTNGRLPLEENILKFYEENKNIDSITLEEALKYANLSYSLKFEDQIIQEQILGSVSNNSLVDNKLKESLETSIDLKKPLLFESYESDKVIDLTNLFSGVEADESELAAISSDSLDDQEEDDFAMDGDEPGIQKVEKTVSKIIDIFGPITGGKDPKNVSKESLARMLGFQGNGKYKPGQKEPVLSAWDKLEMYMLKQVSPYGRSKGMSTVAQRKWWIFESIKLCLMLEKQANFFLGLSDEEKSRLSLSSEEKVKVGQVVSEMRPTGKTLSDSQIREITNQVQQIFLAGDYNLEDSRIKEEDLMKLLVRASSNRGRGREELKRTLDFMYPLHDTRADFDKVPVMSDEERAELDRQNAEFDARRDAEDEEIYGDEIDPETGEKLYADSEEIAKIKSSQKVIEKEKAIQRVIDVPSINMTVIEYKEFMQRVSKDLERLKELDEKSRDKVNPAIFSKLETDGKGNVLPDITKIPDILPAEELTPEEVKEVEEILARLNVRRNITIIGLDQRGEIYDELCDKAVSVDEFIAFRKSFGLDSHESPMNWEDIARGSYGKFRDAAGARQFGVKSWLKGLFYSMSPESKSNVYSYLAERWYDRLKVLDLIDDKAFVAVPDPTNSGQDKAVSASAIEKLSAAGKYSRSKKLEDISDMLELISKYTQPRYLKRYFDTDREDSLDTSFNEKINSLMRYADSEEEYDKLLRRLVQEDEDTASYALIHTMFNGNSGFRIFSAGILKEYYNDVIWPGVESSLALAVKEYFETYYRGSNIGASLQPGQKSDDVRPEEGKELFNKIIYLVMQRTGISSTGSLVPNVGDSKASQISYFKGLADPRGDFAKAVQKFNAKSYSNKLYGRSGSTYNPLNRTPFGPDDVDMLLRDMFDTNSGIIGKVSSVFSKLNSTTEAELISWIGDYPEAKLDQAIILGMALGDFYRKNEVDPTILDVIEKVGKDTKQALADYKKKYKGLLLGKDFAEYLDYEYGYEPLDPSSKGSANPGGKNFQ